MNEYTDIVSLPVGEKPCLTHRQPADRDGTVPDPVDSRHGQFEMGEDVPDLPVLSLGENDGTAPRGVEPVAPCPIERTLDTDSRGKGVQVLFRNGSFCLHHVLPFHLCRRMRKAVARVTIVGEEEQSRGRDVEPANREEPAAVERFKKIDRPLPAAVVGIGGYDAGRFVERQVDQRPCRTDRFTVNGNFIRSAYPGTVVRDDRSVHADASAFDEFVAGATRRDAGGGEIPVDSWCLGSIHRG